jgi:hypothetical protein
MNIQHTTYREVCVAMGLLGGDKEWKYALDDAYFAKNGSSIDRAPYDTSFLNRDSLPN